MKHFGWIAEELTEKGYQIDVSLPKIDKIKDANDIVDYNIKEEVESKNQFLSLSQQTQGPDLQWILQRIANREIHYTDLKRFLESNQLSEKDYSKILSAFTVGSLFKKKD